MFKSRIKGDKDAIADTGTIWVSSYMGRNTGWEPGSSHARGEDNLGYFMKEMVTTWADGLDVEHKKRRVKGNYKILAWGIGKTELPST